jgi:PPOX class probable F420-dependent enzyme
MASQISMTQSEREQFLTGVHIALLAVERPDGPPALAPLWYRYEPGGDLVFTTSDDSIKGGLLRAAGRASLCVQREELPYAYVTVEGPVRLAEATEEQRLELATRYLGEEMGRGYVEANPGNDAVIATLTPERWYTVDYGKLPPPG